jgi:hypothetical protein
MTIFHQRSWREQGLLNFRIADDSSTHCVAGVNITCPGHAFSSRVTGGFLDHHTQVSGELGRLLKPGFSMSENVPSWALSLRWIDPCLFMFFPGKCPAQTLGDSQDYLPWQPGS